MNENINLCEILKDCPKGTKLYSPLFGEVVFCGMEDGVLWPIRVKFHNGDSTVTSLFTKDGRHYNYPNGECLLFPSKDQRDWSKFKAPWLKKPKFDPKTLQPFDRVITRMTDEPNKPWYADFVSHRYEGNNVPEIMSNTCSDIVIPYNDETKHLLGTTEEAPEYYRHWED